MKKAMMKHKKHYLLLKGLFHKTKETEFWMNNGMKRKLAAILVVTMFISLLSNLYEPSQVVKAAESTVRKAINLGTDVINNPQSPGSNTGIAWAGDYIYYGNYYQSNNAIKEPVKWRVLDNGTNYNSSNISSKQNCILLSSDKILDSIKFNEMNSPSEWGESNLKKWLNSDQDTFYGNPTYTPGGFLNTAFSNNEKIAIDETHTTRVEADECINPDVGGAKIFCLSRKDLDDNNYGFPSGGGQQIALTSTLFSNKPGSGVWCWMTRSYKTSDHTEIYTVLDYPYTGYSPYYYQYGVSPVCNLDRNSILFTSAAERGKTSEVTTAIASVEDSSSSSWKLTLKDTSNQHVTLGKPTQTENTLTIPYTNAAYGDNQYISAIITNSTGTTLTHYGKLKRITNNSDAAGTVSLTLPNGFDPATMSVKLFSEQDNGDFKTDYANQPEALNLNSGNLIAITSAAVSDISEPVTLETPDLEGKVPDDANYFILDNKLVWMKDSNEVSESYQADTVYTAEIRLAPKNGYTFLNGEQLSSITVANKLGTIKNIDSNGIATISYTFLSTSKITPEVSVWPTAEGITYGQEVSNSTIDTSHTLSSVEGTYSWVNSSDKPEAGLYQATIRFTPNDAVNYNTVERHVPVTVGAAAVVISLNTTKTSETRIGDTISLIAKLTPQYGGNVDGTVTFKVNGVAVVSGSAISTTGAAISVVNNQATIRWIALPGSNTLSVKYSGSANYQANNTAITDFNLLKCEQQNLNLAEIGDKTYGEDSFSITSGVTGGSGIGNLIYSSSNPEIATINNSGDITIKGIGTTSITVTKESDDTYNQVTSNTVSFTVKKAENPFTISCLDTGYPNIVTPIVTNFPKEAPTVTFYYKKAGEADTAYTTVKPTLAGSYMVRASIPETKNYKAAISNIISFQYQRNTYTVTFHIESDSLVEPQRVLDGETALKPTIPERSGYSFGGWYQEADCIHEFDFTKAITKPTTVYAKWFSPVIQNSLTETSTSQYDWQTIRDSLLPVTTDSKVAASVIHVDMNKLGSTEVPGAIFSSLAGKNEELVLQLGNGVAWTINGTSISPEWNEQNIDFKVTRAEKIIPVDVISPLIGGNPYMEFQVEHEGTFGFDATLSMVLSSGNQGQIASLFYYNTSNKQLKLVDCSTINQNNAVSFTMSHASAYTIIISNQPLIEQNTLKQVSINIVNKTLYRKEKKTKLNIILPDSLQRIISEGYIKVKTSFKSSNKKVAVVDANGTIIPRSKGKAVITTKVAIGDKSCTFKTKINVLGY